MAHLCGQLAQVQLEPQLQEPDVAHPQSPMVKNGFWFFVVESWFAKLSVRCDLRCVDGGRKQSPLESRRRGSNIYTCRQQARPSRTDQVPASSPTQSSGQATTAGGDVQVLKRYDKQTTYPKMPKPSPLELATD